MRISDWSSDVCSSDLPPSTDQRKARVVQRLIRRHAGAVEGFRRRAVPADITRLHEHDVSPARSVGVVGAAAVHGQMRMHGDVARGIGHLLGQAELAALGKHVERITATVGAVRSEEHTSELQSLMRISYAVFCLKKKTN